MNTRESRVLLCIVAFALVAALLQAGMALAQAVAPQALRATPAETKPPRVQSDSVPLQTHDLDDILATPTVRRMLELMSETIELKASLKIQEAETNAKLEIAEFKQNFLREELEKRGQELDRARSEGSRYRSEVQEERGQTERRRQVEEIEETEFRQLSEGPSQELDFLRDRDRKLSSANEQLSQRVRTLENEILELQRASEQDHAKISQANQEMVALATEAQSKLQATYKRLSAQAIDLHNQSPEVLWVDGFPKDPYQEKVLAINRELSQLAIRQKKLQAMIEHAETALKAGRNSESILFMLTADEAGKSAKDRPDPSLTAEQRLKLKLQNMREEQAMLEHQKKLLATLADENQERSRQLQHVLANGRLLHSEINSIATQLDAYTQKVRAINPPEGGEGTAK